MPDVLAGVETIDMSTTVMGQKLDCRCSVPDRAAAAVPPRRRARRCQGGAEKFGTMFGVSSLGTVSVEEIGATITTPKMFQLYVHKDQGLTNSMIERRARQISTSLALTVDTITGGNRERDLRHRLHLAAAAHA